MPPSLQTQLTVLLNQGITDGLRFQGFVGFGVLARIVIRMTVPGTWIRVYNGVHVAVSLVTLLRPVLEISPPRSPKS